MAKPESPHAAPSPPQPGETCPTCGRIVPHPPAPPIEQLELAEPPPTEAEVKALIAQTRAMLDRRNRDHEARTVEDARARFLRRPEDEVPF